jgi:hypothetical protein
MPRTLQLFLALHVAISGADADATRQLLRMTATELPESEAHWLALQVRATIHPSKKSWLANLR